MRNKGLHEKFAGMIGLPLWGVKKGFGTFLTFEVGDLDYMRSKDGVDHGKWHIWVRMAFWRVSFSGLVIVSAFMDIDEQTAGLMDSKINNQRWTIEDISAGSNLNDLSIKCTNTLVIDICIATPVADDEQWAIYMPDRKVISAYGDGRLSIGE